MAGETNVIKRIYPRMSTADFVARSVAIHGDRYDYSESVYQGLKEPFSFVCKRCGTTRTLSQAGAHIRKNKPCGCKPCNHDRPSPCKICGVDVSSKVYHKQGFRCNECYSDHQFSKSSPWASVVKRQVHRHCKRLSPWEVKCKGAMGMASMRKPKVDKKEVASSGSWEETIEKQIRRCLCDQNVQAWERKCRAAFKTLCRRKAK